MEDTIVSVSTAQAAQAVSIIRLSGDNSVNIVKEMFTNRSFIKNPESHRVYYGKIAEAGQEIDEVLVTLMLAPKSYTAEDVVEINCHGGIKITQKILSLAVSLGARPAAPGEFTKRAFLNGRIDLSQAEAVGDLINSSNESALKSSFSQLDGYLKSKIGALRQTLLTLIAGIEVSIDYPEHDGEQDNIESVSQKSGEVLSGILSLIRSADYGKVIHEGIETVIAGRPNVGKSSLLNAVLKEDRAIVTDIPGTTRDILREYVNIGSLTLNIMDTAGIRDTDDCIEAIGAQRAKDCILKCGLVLMVADASCPLCPDDERIMQMISEYGKRAVILLNKTDLEVKTGTGDIKAMAEKYPGAEFGGVIEISARENRGIEALFGCIKDMFLKKGYENDAEFFLHRQRHKDALSRAADSLRRAQESIRAKLGEDFLSQDLTDCYTALGEITGESAGDDIIEKIFSDFCVGK